MRGARTTRHSRRSGADQASQREHGGGPGLVALNPRPCDLHAEHSLRMPLEGARLVGHDVEAGARQIDESAELRRDDPGDGQSSLVWTCDLPGHCRLPVLGGKLERQGGHRLCCQRAAHGREHRVGGLDDAADDRGDLGVVGDLVKGGTPRRGLAGERQRVGDLVEGGDKRHGRTFLRGHYFSNGDGHRGPLS